MPKITNKEYIIAGKKYPCSVWYTASDKFFLKDFPKDIERTAQITPFGNKTEDDLYEKYTEGIERYETIIAQTKKVIIFRICAAKPHLENRYSKHNEDNLYPIGVHDDHGSEMGFTISYEIQMMRTVGESIFLHNIDADGNPYGSGSEVRNERMYKIIDYTPEREIAFKDLYNRFDKMLLSFIDGFNDVEKFIDSIPSTRLLS